MTIPRILGLGSPHGDDQAGWLVIEQLRQRGYPQQRLSRVLTLADLLDIDHDPAPWILCDAALDDSPPGTIARCEWPADRIMTARHHTAHDIPLAEILALRNEIAGAAQDVEIWTIRGEVWNPGATPTTVVQEAAAQLAERLFGLYSSAVVAGQRVG